VSGLLDSTRDRRRGLVLEDKWAPALPRAGPCARRPEVSRWAARLARRARSARLEPVLKLVTGDDPRAEVGVGRGGGRRQLRRGRANLLLRVWAAAATIAAQLTHPLSQRAGGPSGVRPTEPNSFGPVGCINAFMQLVVFVYETTEEIASVDSERPAHPGDRWSNGWIRRLQPERPVRTVGVVVLGVDPQHLLEVAATEDQQPVQALGPDRPDPALRVGVGVRRLHRRDQPSRRPRRGTRRRSCGRTSRRGRAAQSAAVVLVRRAPAAGCGPAG
jgi:hypothetical protein